MKKTLATLLLSLSLTSPVFAQQKPVDKIEEKIDQAIEQQAEKSMEPNPDAIPVLEKLRGGNPKLSYDYLGSKMGMDAWLLSGPELMQIVYTSPNLPGAMVGGALIGSDGKEASTEMTREFMKKYPERAQEILMTVRKVRPEDLENAAKKKTAPTATTPSEILWQRLHQSGKIHFGAEKDAPVLFAILDPAQGATKELWAKFTPLIKAKKITLYVLPLGVTNVDSILEIATVLGSKDPAADWVKLVEGKGINTTETPESAGVIGMKANVELAQTMKLRDVPFLIYRSNENKVRIIRGVPKNWSQFTKDLQTK